VVPVVVPKKMLISRGNAGELGGPCPLGAAMDSSACLPSLEKYCHNGGLAFAS